MSDSLSPHGLQHTRLPWPLPTPRVDSNSCPLSQWCHPTISSCLPLLLPSVFPSIRVFSKESSLRIWWPKYWSFSFSISPSNEYSGLISFRMRWSPEIKGSVCFKYIWRFAETHPLIWKVCVLVFQFHWDWKGNLLLFVERIRGFLFPKFTVCLDFWMTRKSYGKEHESYSNWDAAMFRSRTIYCNSIFIYLWKVLHNAWHISA